ncbi:MAG: ABC transporter substrate-binding protein [Candidatus Marinimicrobia bacterium]|nr:ABC transporter substrate-binding protein [Candidatus Neomarinimicrobiota bacterium]
MRKTLVIRLMLLVVVLLISGCASEPQRGVTDDTIKIGSWGPQTGPAALWGAVPRGTKAYFDMINDEGGIHGRKIEYHMRDDGYQPPKTKAAVKEMVEMEGVFACVGGVGTATGMAVRDYLAENNVPWVGPTSGSTHWAYPANDTRFGVYPLYCHEAAVMVDYAVKEMGKKKIAFFYQNDDYGKLGLYGAETALANHGLELVASVSAEMMDTDLASHAMKLKESGADVVIMWVLPKHAAIMLGTSAKVGFAPQWMTSSTLSDMAVMFKITKGLWKDVIFANFAELPTSDHPLMVKYREAQKKYAPEDRFGVFFYAGILFAEPMVEALKRAGKNLTVDSFVKAMESIDDFQGIGPKLSFGKGKRQGSDSIFLSKCVTAMEAEQLTDWVTSDLDVENIVAKF